MTPELTATQRASTIGEPRYDACVSDREGELDSQRTRSAHLTTPIRFDFSRRLDREYGELTAWQYYSLAVRCR
ncbi:hypothetical protein EV647_0591 [Kribbella sp. VKM Ac-2566]|nr:hypothetical protein EV647_0591 [Kribbella sp. VKM Ac-2566]